MRQILMENALNIHSNPYLECILIFPVSISVRNTHVIKTITYMKIVVVLVSFSLLPTWEVGMIPRYSAAIL